MSVQFDVKGAKTIAEVRQLAWNMERKAPAQWIDLGKKLAQLKGDVLTGGKPTDWYRVFGEDSTRSELPDLDPAECWPFGSDRADKLIKVAKRFGSVENSVLEKLPDSWATLYALTLVKEKTFDEALQRGDIEPRMTRAKALKLRPGGGETTGLGEERQLKTAKAFLANLSTLELKLSAAIDVLRAEGCTIDQLVNAWHAKDQISKAA